MPMARAVLLILLALIACGPLGAQEPSAAVATVIGAPTALSQELVEARIKEIEAATNLDEALKSKLSDHYQRALAELKQRASFEAQAENYRQAAAAAPEQIERNRRRIEELQDPGAAAALPEGLDLTELEQHLAKLQADIAAVTAKQNEIEKEIDGAAQQPGAARQRINQAKSELERTDAELTLPAPEGEAQSLTDARRWALEARRQALRSEILMLDQQLLSHGSRLELLKGRRDRNALELEAMVAEARALEDRLNQRRREVAEQAQAEAREIERQAVGKHALVQGLAQGNAALSGELADLTEELNRLAGQQERIEEQTRRIQEDFRTARQRVELAGLTQALGQVLIDQRNQLPDQRTYRKAAHEREKAMAEATLRQLRLIEERRRLRDLDAYVTGLAAERIAADELETVLPQLRELAERRRNLLDQAIRADESYLRVLGDLDYASNQLIDAITEYDDFLSERLLWVRSSRPVDISTLTALPAAVFWVISPANWMEVAEVLLHELTSAPLFWLQLLLVAVLLAKERALRRRIAATGEPLRRVRTDNIWYTVEAILLTLVLAAAWPLLLAVAGYQLVYSLEATPFTRAAGTAAMAVAAALYYLRAFRLLCMRNGVADRHFRWSGEVLTGLRRWFDFLIAVSMPLGFGVSLVYNYQDPAYSGSLGRIALIALMITLAVFFAKVLHPRHGALCNLLREQPDGWLNRLRMVWYPVAVGTPLALAAITAVGYLYTSGTLLRSLLSSMYLVLGLVVIHQLILRWVILSRRRLALQAALDRRASRAGEEPARPESDLDGLLQVEEPQVDLASLDEQTRQLVNTLLFIAGVAGLWAIWSDVLPAFSVFERFALWHHEGVVDGVEAIVPVTLADIGLILLIGIIAAVAAKNLPALLEIALLQRMEVSSGGRYAVKTLTGYLIVAAAVLTIFSTLGLSWGKVQWLVAALGVGIGFGLQEIVANFISGLIILFERPVRVGDVITIGDTSGVVTKIRIRATTIRNWDKQELLVPNKEFITGRLLNWTLSDRINRLTLPVGVDYNTDVPLALKLLGEAARENQRVLDDPPPLITFEGFGDDALTLVLRCYLDSMDYRLAVTTELHLAIHEKFRAAEISIAFPQRDVHLTTVQPLDVRVHWPQGAQGPAFGANREGERDPGR
jgi:potassium-dependent mechanosensitive channel